MNLKKSHSAFLFIISRKCDLDRAGVIAGQGHRPLVRTRGTEEYCASAFRNLSFILDVGKIKLTMTEYKKELKFPQMESVQRIINFPIVESSWKYAGDIYNKVKNSNNLFTWTLDKAEDSIYNVIDTASPAVFLIEGPLNVLDKVLCRSLDMVEQRVPSITLPPQVIYYNTKEYVVRPVLKRADSMKQLGNQVLTSKYTSFAVDKLDGALDVADKYVDIYLPADKTESQGIGANDNKYDSSNKAIQTIQHMDRFSRKLQRRLTKRTFAEAKALKEQSAEAIHILAYVAELIVTDPKLALQKGIELWSSLSQDEPENQARPENLEQLIILLTRETARRVVHFVNFTTSSVGKLPQEVIKQVRSTADVCLQAIRSIIKTMHVGEDRQTITNSAKSSNTPLLNQINIYATQMLEQITAILAEIQQSNKQEQQQKDQQEQQDRNQQEQQTNKQCSIPQTTLTKPSNQTYPLIQHYETLQPPTSPKDQLKASHRHNIVNGVENASS